MTEKCSVADCDRPRRAKGFCANHYYRLRDKRCTVEGCDRAYAAKGFCRMHWRKNRDPNRICDTCAGRFVGDPRSRFCSLECKYKSQRHPLRIALEDGDLETILTVARESCVVTESGCWEWQFAKNGAGYPMLGHSGSAGLVHRRIAAVALGRPLGRESVHHKCANPACINPDHLQMVSQRENMAEMFARKFYVQRIEELEAALRVVAPEHPLLT